MRMINAYILLDIHWTWNNIIVNSLKKNTTGGSQISIYCLKLQCGVVHLHIYISDVVDARLGSSKQGDSKSMLGSCSSGHR